MAEISFDNMRGVVWFDGKLVDWASARVHVLTHGLHYASSVFEGQRAYQGKIFKLAEHSERLIRSAEILGFEIPWGRDTIDRACRTVLEENGIVDGYLRPIAWRGGETMGVSARGNSIHLAVAAWSWPSYFSPEARLKGVRLAWADWRRPDPRTAPVRAKAAGLYMICTMAKHAAEARGFDDALFLDWEGRLAEATGANVFMVMGDGKLHTPLADCFLGGITRRTVIDLARARGIEVIERRVMPYELAHAKEVFLTGSAVEVTPVGEIDGATFSVGEVSKLMMADYDKAVGKNPEEIFVAA